MVYSLAIVDNDDTNAVVAAKALAQAYTGRITVRILFRVVERLNPGNSGWGFVLVNSYASIDDQTTFTRILAVSFYRPGQTSRTVSIYDYAASQYLIEKEIDVDVHDGLWHECVIHLNTSNGEVYVYVDGIIVYRGTLSGNYDQVSAIEIDYAGSAETGELHVAKIEVFVGSDLVESIDFEDGTEQGFVMANTATGSISVTTDDYDPLVDAKPVGFLSTPLSDVACVYIPEKNKIYFGAGYGPDSSTLSNLWFELDVSTETIAQKTSMPYARWGAPAVYHPKTKKIYVFGGSDNANSATQILQVYDPETDTWTSKNIPYAISQGAMAVYCPVCNKIHIIQHNQHLVYDPETDTWETRSPPPRGSRWGVLLFYRGKLYLAHGFNDDVPSGEAYLYEYDHGSDSWVELGTIPITNGFYGAVREFGWLGNKLQIHDYQDDWHGDFFSRIWEYDPESNSWTKIGQGLFAKDGTCGYITKNGWIYVIGGRDNWQSPILAVDFVEKRNIKRKKLLLFSPHSDVYGFVGEQIEVILLDENNNPITGANVTIYKDGSIYTSCSTDSSGKCTFTPNDPGEYYAEYSDIRSSSIYVVGEAAAAPSPIEQVTNILMQMLPWILYILVIVLIISIIVSAFKD